MKDPHVPTPVSLRPWRARIPASTKVMNAGPSSGLDSQHDGQFAARGFPVPILPDERASAGRLGQDHRDRASLVDGGLSEQEFGARVEGDDLFDIAFRAFRDALDFIQQIGKPFLDLGAKVAGSAIDIFASRGIRYRPRRHVDLDALGDAVRGGRTVLPAALAGRSLDRNHREWSGCRAHDRFPQSLMKRKHTSNGPWPVRASNPRRQPL